MISNPLIYLLSLAVIATVFYLLESRANLKILRYIPAVVMIYALSMLFASFGVYEHNEAIASMYSKTKGNLLPAMLFLMLLQVNVKDFIQLGRKILIAYFLAVVSIGISFIGIALLFNFSSDMSAAFGALAGSWMGGTANMIAVGTALNVPADAFGYALVVDSVDYTLWVMLLLFLVPFASYFDRFTESEHKYQKSFEIGCACSVGTKSYWTLILLALLVSLLSQYAALYLTLFNQTTTIVILATVAGVGASFTRVKQINGSTEIANSMLYLLVALIGSQAVIEDFSSMGIYVFAGLCILFFHAVMMIIGAKIFKLDLFSISVASLANIGGIASAPILAATYDKSLVSIGVLMAIMGYIIGTFGGLLVGNILQLLQ